MRRLFRKNKINELQISNKLSSNKKFGRGLGLGGKVAKYSTIFVGIIGTYVGLRILNFLTVEPIVISSQNTAQLHYRNMLLPDSYYTLEIERRNTDYVRNYRTIAQAHRDNEVGTILGEELDEQTHYYVKDVNHRIGKDLDYIILELNCRNQRVFEGENIVVINRIRKGRNSGLEGITRISLNQDENSNACL